MASLIERIERLRQEQEQQREKQRIEKEEKAGQLDLLKRQKEAELAAGVQLRAAPFINIINELQITDLFKELMKEYRLKALRGGRTLAKVEMSCRLSSSSWVIDIQTGRVGIQERDSLDVCLEEIDRLKKGKDEVKDVGCFLRWDETEWHDEVWSGNEIAVCLAKEDNDFLLKITPGRHSYQTLILTKSDWRDKEKIVDSLARAYCLMDTHWEYEVEDDRSYFERVR